MLRPVGERSVGGVAEDFVLHRPAEQLIDGAVQQLAFEVPQCVVHRAYGVAGESVSSVWRGRAAHGVPALFDRHRALPAQQRREVVVDDGEDGPAHRGHPKPPRSVLGGHDAGGALPLRRPSAPAEVAGVPRHRAGEMPRARNRRNARLGFHRRRQFDGYGSNVFDFQDEVS